MVFVTTFIILSVYTISYSNNNVYGQTAIAELPPTPTLIPATTPATNMTCINSTSTDTNTTRGDDGSDESDDSSDGNDNIVPLVLEGSDDEIENFFNGSYNNNEDPEPTQSEEKVKEE